MLQIGQESGYGLIPLGSQFLVILFQSAVIVPRLACAAPDLNEPNTPLKQAPCNHQLTCVRARPISSLKVLRFVADVERFGGFCLHAERQLKRLNPRFELRVERTLLCMACIEHPQQLKLPLLIVHRQSAVTNVLEQFFHVRILCVDVSSLACSRQKCRTPVACRNNRVATGAHSQKSRQVLVLCSQSVSEPGTETRSRQTCFATVHEHERWFVIRHLGLHRTNHCHVVNVPGSRLSE